MDDFLWRALIGGIGVALVAGPIGCLVVWRRMAYFGAALSHSALLGVALGIWVGIGPNWGIILLGLLLAGLLFAIERQETLPVDTLLGTLAHGALALGVLLTATMETVRIDLMGYLFGDVLAVSELDLLLIFGVATIVLTALAASWNGILVGIVSPDLAAAEGVPVERQRLMMLVMMAMVIGVGMKVVGILLIVSLLLVPAAAARRFSRIPEAMVVLSVGIGVLAVIVGLAGSVAWDIPAGPAIVLVATLVFALSAGLDSLRRRQRLSIHR